MNKKLFKRYPSIQNHYKDNYIDYWLREAPELANEDFIITEKVNGANFQILITSDDVIYGKRSSLLDNDENFFGHKEVMKDYQKLIKDIKSELFIEGTDSVRIFGELYGGNIRPDTDYGKDKHFKIFDIELDNKPLTPKTVIDLLDKIGHSEHYVPIMGVVGSLDEALNFNIRFNTTLNNIEDNITEGVIIKPYKEIYSQTNIQQFTLKLKNKEYFEVKPKKEDNVIKSEVFYEVEDIYKRHLSKNRLYNMFSKLGPIESPTQMREYIQYMANDAKEDFKSDYMSEFLNVPDKERGKIFRSENDIIRELLVDYMAENNQD